VIEGEVLAGSVLLEKVLPTALAVGLMVLGGVWTLLQWFAKRLLSDIEARLGQIAVLGERVQEIEQRIGELPVNYQRRDEMVRQIEQVEARYERAVESVISVLRERVQESERRMATMERAMEEGKREYQRRDDAIREYTAMNAKLDRIYDAMLEGRHGR